MPRPLRVIESGIVYHVLNRGNARAKLFHKPADFDAFVRILAESLRRYDVELLAWCLMSNHWHLLVRPRQEGALQEFMRWLTITHVRRHHAHYAGSTGHLYQGRYRSFPVDDADVHFLVVCRYIEANPKRAGLVKRAQDWHWSSLHQRGLSQPRGDAQALPQIAAWPNGIPDRWVETVNDEMPRPQVEQMRQSLRRDCPFGSDQWVRSIAKSLGLEQTLRPSGPKPRAIKTLSKRQRRRREAQNQT